MITQEDLFITVLFTICLVLWLASIQPKKRDNQMKVLEPYLGSLNTYIGGNKSRSWSFKRINDSGIYSEWDDPRPATDSEGIEDEESLLSQRSAMN